MTPDAPAASSSPLADLRHDLRNPIGNIIGYGEMLIDDLTESGRTEFVPDLEKIRAAGKRLLALVDERLSDASFAALIPRPPLPALREGADAPATGAASRAPADLSSPSPTGEAGIIGRGGRGMRAAKDASLEPEGGDEPGYLLVVDDVAENRDVLTRRLERQGHRVVAAANGADALALLAGGGFDLVLLDILMPDMDGYEVLARIKDDPDLRHTPVLMVSALDQMDSVVRCIEIGAADYLGKPFDPTLLKARVGACLRDKRAHDREARLLAEVQRSYQRLQELERLRDDLTGMIVHDLRTPLTGLLTGMQTVPLAGDLNEVQSEMVALAVEGGQTLLGMINDLLDISKMEDGSLALEVADLDATDLIEGVVGQVAPLARNKDISLIKIAPDVPPFRGDQDKLRRTLVNLVGNAIKFTPAGGTITLVAQLDAEENALVFSVRDTGEGIPEESFGRIFEKFGQVESRKAGRKMSTGLGLTFCRMAVEAHGGRIWVESELGIGSTFSFTVPQSH
jgi:signal transduction histidine kinase